MTAYVESRQRPTTREDGTEKPGMSNGTINRELSVLSRLLRLAYKNGKLGRLPVIELLTEDNVRAGFFERAEYEAVRKHLLDGDEGETKRRPPRPDLALALDLAFTFGWRIRDEILTSTWDRVNLDALTLRLDPGTTKNREGREVSLRPFPDLIPLLEAQRARVEALQKALGRIIPHVFPHLDPESAHAGSGSATSAGPGRPRVVWPASPASSVTISGGPRSGRWSGRGSRGPWR